MDQFDLDEIVKQLTINQSTIDAIKLKENLANLFAKEIDDRRKRNAELDRFKCNEQVRGFVSRSSICFV